MVQNHCHNYGQAQSITFRLDPPVYQALQNACTTSGMSMNAIVNQALANYFLTHPPVPVTRPVYRSNYEETIRQLAGGV